EAWNSSTTSRWASRRPSWSRTSSTASWECCSAAGAPLLARLAAAVDLARPLSPVLADTLAATAAQLGETIAAVTVDPASPGVLAGARGLALRLAYALTTALLVEHAAWGDEQAALAARLWARRWLRHEEIAEDAHHHLDLLC
ncbi:hypothetical protein ACWCO3_32345, partial [Micromonospora sp. NPDC002411]